MPSRIEEQRSSVVKPATASAGVRLTSRVVAQTRREVPSYFAHPAAQPLRCLSSSHLIIETEITNMAAGVMGTPSSDIQHIARRRRPACHQMPAPRAVRGPADSRQGGRHPHVAADPHPCADPPGRGDRQSAPHRHRFGHVDRAHSARPRRRSWPWAAAGRPPPRPAILSELLAAMPEADVELSSEAPGKSRRTQWKRERRRLRRCRPRPAPALQPRQLQAARPRARRVPPPAQSGRQHPVHGLARRPARRHQAGARSRSAPTRPARSSPAS